MKLRIILVVASCLLSVVIGIVLSQQRLSRDLDQRIADQVSRELDRRKADVASILFASTASQTSSCSVFFATNGCVNTDPDLRDRSRVHPDD